MRFESIIKTLLNIFVVGGFFFLINIINVESIHAATFTVTNTNDSGAGSLRQAITDANAAEGIHTIDFNIPGSGPHTITPTSILPGLGNGTHASHSITLDGCTQPGSVCDAFPLTLNIHIDGVSLAAGNIIIGAARTNGGITVRGLSITNSPSAGIRVIRTVFSGQFWHPDNLTIEYNYIGLQPDGTAAANSTGLGLIASIGGTQGSDNFRISNNVISSNTNSAIVTNNNGGFSTIQPMDNLIIENNIIGLDPTATVARPNGNGAGISGTSGATIRDNIISNNTGYGLEVRMESRNLLIENNTISNNGSYGVLFARGLIANPAFIGPVTMHGNIISNNTQNGIEVNNAPDITIGGLDSDEENTISNNGVNGVLITGANSLNINVIGNDINDNNQSGVLLNTTGADNYVDSNSISVSTHHGISATSSANLHIRDNNIHENTLNGINLSSTNNATITGNNINNNNSGVVGTSLPGSVIQNNIVTDNSSDAIVINSTIGVSIGGILADQANQITDNDGRGIVVGANASDISRSISIRGNSIHNNSGIGIDLASDGVTNNDLNDPDSGPNARINYPVINYLARGSIIIGGYINAVGGPYTLDFYMSPAADSSGHGEGHTYIGSTSVSVASNIGTFNVTFPETLPDGWVITATAFGPFGSTDTSEFSLAATVSPTAVNDIANTLETTEVIVSILGNDLEGDNPIDASTVKLIEPDTSAQVDDLIITGEGEYNVNPDGTISFTPEAGFTGATTPVNYIVFDENNMTSNQAEIIVTVSIVQFQQGKQSKRPTPAPTPGISITPTPTITPIMTAQTTPAVTPVPTIRPNYATVNDLTGNSISNTNNTIEDTEFISEAEEVNGELPIGEGLTQLDSEDTSLDQTEISSDSSTIKNQYRSFVIPCSISLLILIGLLIFLKKRN